VSTANSKSGPYLGALLRLGWQFVRDEIFSGVIAAGYEDLNPAHVGLFRYPTLDRQRPSEVAEQLRITRQSVNDLLGHLERRGYVTREPDPTDGRARMIRLTAKGRRLEKTINAQAKEAELKIAQWLGPESFSELRTTLETLASNAADVEATPDR
jgi:DNA-binding MarR family transcriptional regulator